ncbi:hypothetical protein [Glutamicibacter ardleyensis]
MNKQFPHGIDITAPGGIEALMAFHFKTFGIAQMNANAGGDTGATNTGATGTTDDGSGAGATTAGAETTTTETTVTGTQATTNAPPWGSDEEFNAEKAWNLVQGLRADKAKLADGRETAIQDAVAKAVKDAQSSYTQDIAKALGLVADEPDPAKLLETVTGERDTLTGERDTWKNDALDAKRQLGVFTAASVNNADATKLLDSMSFMNKVKDFDPAADDFNSQVETVVKAAVEADKSLRVQAAAARGGGDLTGGNGTGQHQLSREDLAGMSPAEILKANKEGRLKTLATNPKEG